MASNMTDWIVATSSLITSGAIVLQFLMWKVAKEQNDLQSKPRLRLKPIKIAAEAPKALSEVAQKRLSANVVPNYQVDIEQDWRGHVQIPDINLTSVKEVHAGFVIENTSPVQAFGVRLHLEIAVSGNPSDGVVKPKTYHRDLAIECDIPPWKGVFVPILTCRMLFDVTIAGKITAITGPLGKDEILKEEKQPKQTCSFQNESLLKALVAKPAPNVEEYDPFANE